MITPSDRSPIHKALKPAESRVSVALGVGLGLLAGSLIAYLWVVFAGAAYAGNSAYFNKTFMPVSVGVFGLYVVITLALFFLRCDRLAMLLAWIPVILIYVSPVIGSIAHLFGKK